MANNKKLHVKEGDRFGRLSVVGEIASVKSKAGKTVRMVASLCDCGVQVHSTVCNLVYGNTKSCGSCGRTHGMTGTPTYTSWESMRDRCASKNKQKYPKYAGRGISVCGRWENSFENFLEDMGERPEGTSLDRIDVNGDYTPENCRWVCQSIQSFNQKVRKNNSSGRAGVRWSDRENKWVARITKDYKDICLYYGDDFFEACCARASAELDYYGFVKE